MKKIILIASVFLLAVQCSKNQSEPSVSPTQTKTATTEISTDSLKNYAGETKKLLVKNLTQKIEEGGAENALEFCNIEAMPLTKSMSEKHGLQISRVTDKPRNSSNLANDEELKLIEKYKQQILAGETLAPTRTATHYYEPLVTNAMCLQCHGEKGKNIQTKTLEKIAQLYPNDLATGYKENEVRGLISIKTN